MNKTSGDRTEDDTPTFGFDSSDFQDAVPIPSTKSATHPGAAREFDLEMLVKILSRVKPGRAGAADGVAAEFVVALTPDGKEALAKVVMGPLGRHLAHAHRVVVRRGRLVT